MNLHRGAQIEDASIMVERITEDVDFDPVQRPDRKWTTEALRNYLGVPGGVARDIGYDFTHTQE